MVDFVKPSAETIYKMSRKRENKISPPPQRKKIKEVQKKSQMMVKNEVDDTEFIKKMK